MKSESFRIWGIKPQAKQSVRGGSCGFYQPKNKKSYVDTVALLLSAQKQSKEPFSKACLLKIDFVFGSKKLSGPKPTRPDIDNLLKPVKDAITKAGIWTDDSLCCMIQANKVYGVRDCIKIEINEI